MSSEVARLRQQLVDEYLAGKRGLEGLASGTARHAVIARRMENMYRSQQQLEALVGKAATKQIIIETFASVEGGDS